MFAHYFQYDCKSSAEVPYKPEADPEDEDEAEVQASSLLLPQAYSTVCSDVGRHSGGKTQQSNALA